MASSIDRDDGVGPCAADPETDELLSWLRQFERDNGRPLRVLHIGNIAGNGFLNSKFLRQVGVAADIVCHDYTHVMAMPEWEELDLQHSHGDDFNPIFDPRDLAGYERPSWFIAGPLALCVDIIKARYSSSETGSDTPAQATRAARATLADHAYRSARRLFGPQAGNIAAGAILRPGSFVKKAFNRVQRRGTRILKRLGFAGQSPAPPVQLPPAPAEPRYGSLINLFRHRFPCRPDQLTEADVAPYAAAAREYADMMAPYDIVQCYATEPINALLAGKRPYVAFEHGTLRHFTTDDHPLHRLTSLAYREADHTFITNGDCLAYAKRLGIEDYSAVIHPIDVDQHRLDFGAEAKLIRERIGAEVLIYCPIRHDYEIKGTDRALKALPLIKARTPKRVKIILSTWGTQVEESRRMLRDLGCENDVVWLSSMCRLGMIKHIHAADVVFDQFVLPVFGSTAPQTIAAGKPILSSYVPAETAWLIPEPAPIVSAYTPEEIAERTIECLDPAWLAAYAVRARNWVDRYHSPANVVRDHLRVYRRVLAKHAPSNAGAKSCSEADGIRAAGAHQC